MAYVVTKANWDALLENDYVTGKIAEAINVAAPFREEIKRVGMTSGRMRIYGVQVGASQGQGARAELGGMPGYGAGEYQDATVTTKYNYAPFKISGPAETFGSKKAFAEFGVRIIKDTVQGFKLFVGRQTWGDGQGTLAMVNGAIVAGVTTVTVDSAFGVLWGSFAGNTTFLIKRKMMVQFGTENNGGLGYEVATVTGTTFTFTPALANNVADNVNISMLGSANLEITGALAFAATAAMMTTLGLASTVYNGINRTTFPEFEGNVINAGAALSLALIRSMRDTIYKRTDDEESNLMIGSTEMARDYEALLIAGQRFVPPTKLEGGHTILEHDGLRFSKDSRAPAKALFFFDTKHIAWAQGEEPNWLKDASGIMRVVPGQDAKEALYRWYSELDVDEPRRQGYIFNVTST
jgi:hypothetical protein